MAIVRAVKSGNWSDTTVWNTGALPTSADDVYSNTFTVTIDVSPTVLSISNGSTTGVTAGGGFAISANGITLTANVNNGFTATAVLTISVGAGNTANVIGNITGASSGASANALTFSGAGTVNVTGNCLGGGTNSGTRAFNLSGSGTLNITGNITGGSALQCDGGAVTGAGTLNVTGNITGSTNCSGVFTSAACTITVVGSISPSTTSSGLISSSTSANIALSGPFLASSNSVNPIYCAAWRWISTQPATYYQVRSANLSVIRPLYTADSVGGNPAVSNVRSGTVYGPSNELTGTCAVPPAGSVALGVPVDNTTGTAAITAANIRSAVGLASANLDTQLAAIPTTAAPSASSIAAAVWSAVTRTITGGTVDTLTNAPSVPSAAAIASQVRTELAPELGNLDATISSRLPSSGYTAPPSAASIATAVWSAATRTLTTAFDSSATIAAAVWSAATRTLTSSSAPSAADNAAAVWGYSSGRTVTGGTVDTVTNSTPVDAGEIADAVRTELTPELARLSNAATTQEVGDIVEGALAD